MDMIGKTPAPDGGAAKEDLKTLMQKRDRLVYESINQMEELSQRLRRGEIDRPTYTQKVAAIEKQIADANTQVNLHQSKEAQEIQRRHVDYIQPTVPPHVRGSPYAPMKYAVALVAVMVLLVYAASHYQCIPVSFTSKMPRIFSLMDLLQQKSPDDYRMLCRYSNGIDYTPDSSLSATPDAILLSAPSMARSDDREMAGVIVHEACHNMMRSIMGGRGGMKESEVERPCVRMQYLSMYRTGFYKSYLEMVDDLAREPYGRDNLPTTSRIPPPIRRLQGEKLYEYDPDVKEYCSGVILQVTRAPVSGGYNLRLANRGTKKIHCGFVELTVNRREYPLDCQELAPGQSHTTGRDFVLQSIDTYNVKVVGCGEAQMAL
jgi:hypothetical protein